MPLTTRSARILAPSNYLAVMLKNAFKPCLPNRGIKVPAGKEWLHSAYRGGRFDRWVKLKNRSHPAFRRVRDAFA